MTISRARLPFDRWRAFTARTEPDRAGLRFVAAFFGILCLYDFFDLYWGGTATSYWLVADAQRIVAQLRVLQFAMLGLEAGIVLAALRGVLTARVRRLLAWAIGAAFVLRAAEAWLFFGLNDFYYFSVTAFLLAHLFTRAPEGQLPLWPRRVLLYQTAWIYLATGVLKLNPHWLSGEHLWIRQRYLAEVLHWPYPEWFRAAIAHLELDQALAVAGAAGEISLGLALFFGAPRWVVVGLAAAMHGFAAVALNVWFFGAAMVAQVCFVAAPRSPRAPTS